MTFACCLFVMLSAVPSEPGLDAGVDFVAEQLLDAGVVLPMPDGASVTAKFGEGVTFRSGEFKLQLRGRVQVQALSVFPTEGSSTLRQNAIFVRRARLALKGEFPFHLSVNLQLAFANLDMEPDMPNVLRDFNIQWAPFRDLSFRLGQMKVPFDVQRVISSSSQQFVDRSLVTAELNLDRDVGLVIYSEDLFGLGQRLRYSIGVFGGDGRNRIGTNVGLLYGGRLRYSPLGAFDDKLEGDPDRDPNFRIAFGAAAARNVQSNRPRSTTGTPYRLATFDSTHAAGDVHVKWRGLSLLSEVYWRQADTDSFTGTLNGASLTEYSRSGWGWFAQVGGYLTPWLELAARYGDLLPLGATDPSFKRVRELGGTVNLMFLKHDLKLQTDFFWIDESGRGRLQLRIQAQVYF
jgi:phosphate-selective porin OprO and OprP